MHFRWKYISLPLAVLLLSVCITACFYRLLPVEVAYHFDGGSPDKWMSRGATIGWLLIPQFLFALVAMVIVWGVTRLSIRLQQVDGIVIEKLLYLVGNMVVLPQIILSYAVLDISLYNVFQIHIMPLWLFAVVVMVLGVIILGILFFSIFRRVRLLFG